MHMRVHSDNDICGFGTTLWLMGDRAGAAQVWSRVCEDALKGRFTYSSTGTFKGWLLLWFASVWLKDEDWHDEAAALLDKLLRKKQPAMGASFYINLARLLRREVSLDWIQSGFSDWPESRNHEARLALFYAGVSAYEIGDVGKTRQLWSNVQKPKEAEGELEYYLLAHELPKLRKSKR